MAVVTTIITAVVTAITASITTAIITAVITAVVVSPTIPVPVAAVFSQVATFKARWQLLSYFWDPLMRAQVAAYSHSQ